MEEKKRRPIEPIHSCEQCLKLIKAARAHISVIGKQMELFRFTCLSIERLCK
jgi:hypothetical protein